MSGRGSRGQGWQQPTRTPTWVYALVGVLLTLAVVLAIVVFMLLGSGPGGLASASSTPTITPTAASTVGGSPTAEVTPEITAAATPEITAAPTPEITPPVTLSPGSSGSPAPSGSIKPTLVSITLPHKADCNGQNGTGQVGMISIDWSTLGATGVRISIDPPTPAGAYDYGYADYPTATGPAVVPYACGQTLHDSGGYYHLYVVTTLHTTGYYQYRYQKVYQSPAPTPTP
jgi:hypothetical protein